MISTAEQAEEFTKRFQREARSPRPATPPTQPDAAPTALDLRRSGGRELQPLHEDLRIVYGPDHEETREVADLLARLRLQNRG